MSKSQILKGYLPSYYNDFVEMGRLTDSEGAELELLEKQISELLDQYYPESATWGLERYEKDLQINTIPDKPFEQRRSVIISKMRGSGKVSAQLIKEMAEAYDGGQVDVSVQPADYTFTIHFIDTIGIPPNLNDLKEALEEIKPAHLAIGYTFRYLLIRDIHEVMTLTEMEQTLLSKFAGGA
ncbi:putative phage tail protein [Paenibacillus enshidis]|uniref:Phage tail protein n=1 Tax=Paenibacillus enshidis TaxID=1458439 RepID=A0ABV5ASA3_9BACL